MSEEKSTVTKTVTLLLFSGEKKDYEVQLKRFVAYATIKGFSQPMKENHVLPMDPEVLTTTGDDKQKELHLLQPPLCPLGQDRTLSGLEQPCFSAL